MKNQKLKKIGIFVLVLAVIFVLGSLAWRNFTKKLNEAMSVLQQGTVAAARGDLEVKVSGTGSVVSAVEEEIRTRISGTISEFYLKDGQAVQKGQVLARLDVEDLGLKIENAKLSLTIAERELAKLRQEKTADLVTAPAAGRISWKVKEGDLVQKSSVIGTIQDFNKLKISGKFNSTQIQKIQVGQEAEIFLEAFLTSVPAKVVEVKTESIPSGSGGILFDVIAEFDNPGALAAGMKGRLTVVTPDGEKLSVADSTLFLPEAVDVRSPITGTITKLHVQSEKEVNAGAILAEIGNPELADSLEEQIATAELRLKQVRLELEELESQQAKRADNSTVLAPISGTLVLPAIKVGVGDMVSQGTVLGTVIDYSQLQAIIPVDELDVAKIKIGQEVNLTAEALPEQKITGTVSNVSAQGLSQSGVATFDVTIAIDPVEGLKVGMTVNADILIETRQNVLLVPIEAVRREGGRNFVMVAEPVGDDGIVVPQQVEVKTGAHDTTLIEIVDGLSEGQEVYLQNIDFRGSFGAGMEVQYAPPGPGGF